MEKSCRSVRYQTVKFSFWVKFRLKILAGFLLNLFLKAEGVFSANDFQRGRTQLFPGNLTLLIACLLVLVIAGQYQIENLLNTFLRTDIDQSIKYMQDVIRLIAPKESFPQLGLQFGLGLGSVLELGDNFPRVHCPRTKQEIHLKFKGYSDSYQKVHFVCLPLFISFL